MDKNLKLMFLLVYAINLVLLSACCFGEPNSIEKQLKIIIADKAYTLSDLKKQFKTIRVSIPFNPAYNNVKKVYYAFDMNQILTKLLAVDLQKNNVDQVLLAQTADNYMSQTPCCILRQKVKPILLIKKRPKQFLTRTSPKMVVGVILINTVKKIIPALSILYGIIQAPTLPVGHIRLFRCK